jgi:hypothetical protein
MLEQKYKEFQNLKKDYTTAQEKKSNIDLHSEKLKPLKESIEDIEGSISAIKSYENVLQECFGLKESIEIDEYVLQISEKEYSEINGGEIEDEKQTISQLNKQIEQEEERLEQKVKEHVKQRRREVQETLVILNIPEIKKNYLDSEDDIRDLKKLDSVMKKFLKYTNRKNAEKLLERYREKDDLLDKFQDLDWEKVRKEKGISKDTEELLKTLFNQGKTDIDTLNPGSIEEILNFGKLSEQIQITYEEEQ